MANPTLDDANAAALIVFDAKYTPTLNGIDCNSCGSELKDIYPGLQSGETIPQTPVICDTCGFTGLRII